MVEKRIHSNILSTTTSSQRKTRSDKGDWIENFGTNCSWISSTNNTLITDIFILLALCVPKVWWFYIQPHNSLCRSSLHSLLNVVWYTDWFDIPTFCDHYQWKEILYFYFAHTNRCGYMVKHWWEWDILGGNWPLEGNGSIAHSVSQHQASHVSVPKVTRAKYVNNGIWHL